MTPSSSSTTNNPETKHTINLLRGWPAPSLLPSSALLRSAQTCLTDPSISVPALQYGPDPGYQPLRIELSSWLSDFYSNSSPFHLYSPGSPSVTSSRSKPSTGAYEVKPEPDPERICITGGASQNLACVLQVFTDPNVTRVWMVEPCYFLGKRIFEDAGLRCRGVGEGEGGVDLRALEEGLSASEDESGGKALKRTTPWSKIYRHIIYCVPTFSNPSGKTMTLSTRIELVRLARKYDALIVSDDVYDFLQWPSNSTKSSSPSKHLSRSLLPRLVDIDRTLPPVPSPTSFGNALSNGSFSKICGPGVRTGWAESSTPRFAYGLSQTGSSRSGGAPSQLTATMMAEMLRTGDLREHIEEVLRPAYQQRFETMVDAVVTFLVPLGVRLGETGFSPESGGEGAEGTREEERVFGGYFMWIHLPESLDAEEIAATVRAEEHLVVAPGALFEVANSESEQKFANQLRLCFSWEKEQDLRDGVERLGVVVKREVDGLKEGRTERKKKADITKGDLGEFR